MKYIFHEEAEKELNRQIDYYEEIQPGLGEDFFEEVLVTLSRIMQNPIAWQKIRSGHRRCLTNRFPYSIVYSYEKNNETIRVVAVKSQYQKPGYWKSRKV